MANNPAGAVHILLLNSASRGAIETLDRVASRRSTRRPVVYPNNASLVATDHRGRDCARHRLRVVRGAPRRYDTHAEQGGGGGGAYANLMGRARRRAGGLLQPDTETRAWQRDTTIVVFSEFSARV
jgi:hypothetical protein